VSFWARRGPDGQPGLRVALGDQHTDDDLAFEAYKYGEPLQCERVRECGCRSKPCSPFACPDKERFFCFEPGVDPDPLCSDLQFGSFKGPCEVAADCTTGKPCTPLSCPGDARTRSFCFDPAVDEPPACTREHLECGQTECDSVYDAADESDPQFAGRPCTYYEFRGGVVGDFCYDPEIDPPPAENNQLCGDHWLSPVTLTTEWQFFKVPFTDLLQQGWAKKFFVLDLTNAALVRLTFDKGWVDHWIDDVSFYRRRAP
jgi:hypothetical protein